MAEQVMADGGREKRLKSSEDAEDGIAVAGEASNRDHKQGRGQHGPLPNDHPQSFAVDAAVDLSRVDTSLVKHISSFLGTSRELLNLALTCKSFGWRQTGRIDTNLNSLVEEVARQEVCLRATDEEMRYLSQYARGIGTTTWLLILHRFERLLLFDVLLGGHIEHQNGDKTTVQGTHDTFGGSAVSSNYVMRTGEHYAEFQITGSSIPCVGIVRPMPELDASNFRDEEVCFGYLDLYPIFLAQKTREWCEDKHACFYWTHDGLSFSTNWDWGESDEGTGWEGMESCISGDTVGMLLNLDEGTLTVYRNNRLLGVMEDGLSGPFCWCAFVNDDGVVTIRRGQNKTLKGQRTLFDYEFSRTTVRRRPPFGQT